MLLLFYIISLLAKFKASVTIVHALTHRSAILLQDDDSFIPQAFSHLLDDHISKNAQIYVPYSKELHQVVNNITSHITKPFYLKAKKSENLKKNLTGITNAFSRRNYATYSNIASETFKNQKFLSNSAPSSFIMSNPLDISLLKLNQRHLFGQGKTAVSEKSLKHIIKHSNDRREKKYKTPFKNMTQHETLFHTRLREATKHSNYNGSTARHKKYPINTTLHKKQKLNSATYSNRTRTKKKYTNYAQNASRKENNTTNTTTKANFNHDGKSENGLVNGNKSTAIRHNNINTSNVTKPMSSTNTSYNSGYKYNTSANSSRVGYESSPKHDLQHFMSNRTVKNGSSNIFPTSRMNKTDSRESVLNDEMQILLLRSEQKKKKFSPSERIQKTVKWLKSYINSEKAPMYFDKKLLQELVSRGTELRKQAYITPAHRAALTTDIQQAAELFLGLSRRQNKKRVLKIGTIPALLYLATLNSQGYAVDMTCKHFVTKNLQRLIHFYLYLILVKPISFKQSYLWRARHHEIIRKVLFG
jgi:hypothetical protein